MSSAACFVIPWTIFFSSKTEVDSFASMKVVVFRRRIIKKTSCTMITQTDQEDILYNDHTNGSRRHPVQWSHTQIKKTSCTMITQTDHEDILYNDHTNGSRRHSVQRTHNWTHNRTLKIVGPFYLVSMSVEVKYDNQASVYNIFYSRLTHSLNLQHTLSLVDI